MTYPVVLIANEEGFSVGCPALPGCWSQGSTREEALANIREAIALWLDVQEEDIRHEVEADGVHFSHEVGYQKFPASAKKTPCAFSTK